MMPDKHPPLQRSRRHGEEISFYTPNNFQKKSMILKADQNSRKVYSAMWLIVIFGSWIALLGFLVFVFSG